MRRIVLDTETTGLAPSEGHRVIEIGAVELVHRRVTGQRFHVYLQPDRAIDEGAMAVHGITDAFLSDKPRFADVVESFLTFIQGAELVIHNAAFDLAFLDHELRLAGVRPAVLAERCPVVDTLALARRRHPGQRNSLDALCKRYAIDNSHRTLHGALLDAEILADVYLAMTGGQVQLGLDPVSRNDSSQGAMRGEDCRMLSADRPPIPVLPATPGELSAHEAWVRQLDERGGRPCLWHRLDRAVATRGQV